VFFCLKALLRSLILPPAGPMILAIVGALMIWRRRRFGGPVLALGLGSLWLAATPVVADALSRLTVHYRPLDLSKPTRASIFTLKPRTLEDQLTIISLNKMTGWLFV
jgi:hypothetical protein